MFLKMVQNIVIAEELVSYGTMRVIVEFQRDNVPNSSALSNVIGGVLAYYT